MGLTPCGLMYEHQCVSESANSIIISFYPAKGDHSFYRMVRPIPEYQNLKVNVGKIPTPIIHSVLKTHWRWLKVSFVGHTTFLQKTQT